MHSHYQHHACKELAQGGLLGSWFYVVIWLVILTVTPLWDEWRALSLAVIGVLALLGAIRLGLGLAYLRRAVVKRQNWLYAYSASVLLMGLTWGGVTGFSFWFYTPDWTAYLVGFSAAGIVAGGTIALSSHRLLQTVYIATILAPPTVVLLFMGTPQALVLAVLFVLNMIFLVGIGRQLNAQYWSLRELSDTDALTGLANRRRFDRTLEDEVQRANRSGSPLTLILLDIDYFKSYNDNYGHVRGDDCLEIVARRIAQTLRRPQDLAARYGGEEFACILPACTADGAHQIAERLQAGIKALRIPHLFSPVSANLTVSMGVLTITPTIHSEPESLLGKVDELLYQSKKAGRNRISYLKL